MTRVRAIGKKLTISVSVTRVRAVGKKAHDFSERDACARLDNKLTISVSGTVNKNERQARCLKHARYTYGKRNLAAARGR